MHTECLSVIKGHHIMEYFHLFKGKDVIQESGSPQSCNSYTNVPERCFQKVYKPSLAISV